MGIKDILDMENKLYTLWPDAVRAERELTQEEMMYWKAFEGVYELRKYLESREENECITTNAKNAGHI